MAGLVLQGGGSAMLTHDAIEELKKIYREENGEELTDDEAREMGERLLRVFAWLFRTSSTGTLKDEDKYTGQSS